VGECAYTYAQKNEYCPFTAVPLLNFQKSEENKICMQHLHFQFEVFCMYNKLQVIQYPCIIKQLAKISKKMNHFIQLLQKTKLSHMFSQPSTAAPPFVLPHTGAITAAVMYDYSTG
jgi:hypothetical protein